MARRLSLVALLLLATTQSASALTLQSSRKKFPGTTVAGLTAFVCPSGSTCTAIVTDATASCVPGTTPTGGGTNKCRVAWNGTHWVVISANPVAGSCPAGYLNFASNGGVSDHQGIKFGSCSGIGGSKLCTYTQPVTCSTTAGSNLYTIAGYTPTSADIGKDLIIGMPLKINGSTSTIGAGGSSFPGQPLRVRVLSVSGQTISGTTLSNGSSSPNAGNTVTNAECDIETDNGPAMQSLVTGGNSVCVPPGAYGFDSGVQITKNNVTIFCLPGAVFYDARNDSYASNFFNRMLFTWQNASGGGANGCTYVSTNTGVYWKLPGQGSVGQGSWPYYTASSNNLTFQNLIDLNIWADADVELSLMSDTSPGSNFNTVTNVYTQGGWAYGPSVIAGHDNIFSNDVMRNACHDIEPNNSYEGSQTYHNTFTGFTCINDGMAYNSSTNLQVGGNNFCQNLSCSGSTCCSTSEVVQNGTVQGNVFVFPACPSGNIGGTWGGIAHTSNNTGSPTCECDSHCF